MNLEEYLETADDIAIIRFRLFRIQDRLQNKWPKSHRVMKAVWRLVGSGSPLDALKNYLDSAYHADTTEEEFSKHGHVFYNLEQRVDDDGNLKVCDGD
jgi:hypothetical protein